MEHQNAGSVCCSVAGRLPAGPARLRRDAGESVEEVSRFLDHRSLAVPTTYLRRLEGQEDRSWAKVAGGYRGF